MKHRDEPITSSLGLENLDSVELSHIYAAGQNGCLLRLYWTCCGHLMVLQFPARIAPSLSGIKIGGDSYSVVAWF
jgi:hypothetical protein